MIAPAAHRRPRPRSQQLPNSQTKLSCFCHSFVLAARILSEPCTCHSSPSKPLEPDCHIPSMSVQASLPGLTRPEAQVAPCRLLSSASSNLFNPHRRASSRLAARSCRATPRLCSTCRATERPHLACSSTEQDPSSPSCSETHSLSGWLPLLCSSPALLSLLALPAQAADVPQLTEGGFSKSSYYVTLGLFLLSVPGQSYCHGTQSEKLLAPTLRMGSTG